VHRSGGEETARRHHACRIESFNSATFAGVVQKKLDVVRKAATILDGNSRTP
jgi:hypothetical protein